MKKQGSIEDEDSDIDTEEIKGQLKTMQEALQRHFGHHKVRYEVRHNCKFRTHKFGACVVVKMISSPIL